MKGYMKGNKRFLLSAAYIVALHALLLVFLTAFRAVEYAVLHHLVADSAASVWPAFVRGVWFDNVIACYISVLPLAVVLMAAVAGCTGRTVRRVATWWYAVLGCVAFMPSAANTPYFAYFFKNINSSIFEWFGYAGTTAGMVTGETSYFLYIAQYAVFAALYVFAAFALERRMARAFSGAPASTRQAAPLVARGVAALALVGLCLFGIRGRIGYNPIKVSQAYYCRDAFLNQLGINPAFNLLTSALDDMRRENRDLHLMPYGEAISEARRSLGIAGACDSLHVLRRQVLATAGGPTPNVVVILMESMSASLMQTFGNADHLTPTLDSLYRHSMAFTRCYSAGIHTNHGMTATLYSFPALMFRNLMKGTVTPRRDGLPTVLHQQGYHTMFFMPHEAQYDNMKAFFSTNGYDDIYAQEDYPGSEVVNSFGVSDRFLFSYALRTIGEKAKTRKPFFATILTVSNHPPYVIPAWFKPHSTEAEQQIVEYADHCLGQFLQEARRQPWYRNTLFVVVADHGKMVGKVKGELPESYNHIPLAIFGPGVKEGVVDNLATQVDVMPTVLSLLGQSYVYDGFGIDQTTAQRPMVFYSADNQLVARSADRLFIYEPQTQRSFCYRMAPDGTLAPDGGAAFAPLRRYVFSMIQTAQWMLKHEGSSAQ